MSTALTVLADKTPAANDVVAGWGAFGLFILGIIAVAFLGYCLSRSLKTAARNAEKGVFDPSDKKPRRTTI